MEIIVYGLNITLDIEFIMVSPIAGATLNNLKNITVWKVGVGAFT